MQIAKKVLAVFLAVLFVLPGLGVGLTASAALSSGECGIEDVENAINDIGGDDGSNEYLARVATAYAVYSNLSDSEKQQVSNYNVLEAAIHASDYAFGVCGDCVGYAWEMMFGDMVIGGFGPMIDYSAEDSPFYQSFDVSKVVIANGVTSVGSYAFEACDNLTSVTFPDDGAFTAIGDDAFCECRGLKSVTLPQGLTTIGEFAFSNTGLKSVTIPGTVTQIGEYAFDNIPATSVTIPKSLTAIPKCAFLYNDDLLTLNYTGGPADWNAMSIHEKAFFNASLSAPTCYYYGVEGAENAIDDVGTVEYTPECKARIDAARAAFDALSDADQAKVSNAGDLTAAEQKYAQLEAQATELAKGGDCSYRLSDVHYTFDKSTCTLTISGTGEIKPASFQKTDVIRHVVIEQGVTNVSKLLFYSCTGLQSVTIPSSVTMIDDEAFQDCSALTSVTLPDGLQSIGKKAFENCSALTSVTLPHSLERTDADVFRGCTALMSVTIPDSMTLLNRSVFQDCSSLTDIYYTGSEADWNGMTIASSAFAGTPDTRKVHYYYGVEGATNAINDVGDVEYTPACKARIDAARAAFDALSDADKALVSNAGDLTAAEAEYARLETAANKAINLVSGEADYIKGAQESCVWFGNYKQSGNKTDGWSVDPIKWRVLSNADGKLFLLSDQNLDACVYYERYFTVTWETSTIRAWLNGTGEFSEENFKDSAFSSGEDAAVCVTDVSNPDSVFDDRTVPGGSDTADKVFLLSRDEAMNTAYGFTDSIEPTDTRVSINTAYTGSGGSNYGWTSAGGSADYWWLRSPGSADDRAAIVFETGQLNPGGYDVPNRSIAVRPAVNVDLGKVLFTSAAENGKQGDGLTAVRDYTGSDWKLTLLDDSRSGFTASGDSRTGDVWTVNYSGAKTGDNEYISAVIVDGDGAVTYYGRLCKAESGDNNTVMVDVSGKMNDGDTLYVFNEQTNGDKKTDYASALVDVTERSILKYDLWVGDTEVTEECTSGEGWEYAPATNTLTLNDYQYEGEGHSLPDDIIVYSADTSRAAIVYSGSEPLNLVLEGDNAVKQTGGDLRTSVGVFSEGALTVSGTGALTAEAGEATLDVESQMTYTSGLLIREKLTVTGGTVTGRGGTGTLSHNTWGIYAKGFELSGGEVYAYGGSVTGTGRSIGLRSDGAVTVSGEKLTCRGGKSTGHSDGLRTGSNMTVTGGSVDVSSGDGSKYSYGIEGARRGDVLYIGASVDSFVSVGIYEAVDSSYLTVKNELPGKGWKTVDATDDAIAIAVNPDPGAKLSLYKKVEFKQFKKYDLWVGGVQFDEDNLEINANDIPSVTGSATYDPENNELTLDGFQYTGEGYRDLVDPGTQNEQYYAAGIYYTGTDELTVRLVQENAVTVTGDATNSYGFRSENLRTAVTFTGTGSLTARGADNAQSISYGITVSGSLCVEKQATVTGVGGDSSKSSYGVTTYVLHTKLEVYGKLTGNGGSASNISCGVYGAEITVGTDAVLTAAGSAGDSSRGIIADSVTVRSGTVEAASGEGERYSLAFKAKTGDNIAFDLSDDLTMRAGESKDENEIVTGDGWKNQKYVLIGEPATFSVTVTAGEGMTKTADSGDASQTVEKDSAMTAVVYTANTGYYFPTDYAVDSVNGVSVTRISFTQITVSGTPTADVTLTLPSPKEMADPQTAVCRIKDVYYATIGEAIEDVTANDTVITILRDCEFDGLTEVAGHDIILESGERGVTVTLTGAMKFGKNNQSEIFTLRGNPAADTTLTIKPKLTDGTNAFRPIAVRSGNTLTVESGAVLEGSRFMTGNGGMVNVAKNATLNLNGGTIRDCGAIQGGAVYVDGGNCTIYEGRIENCIAEQGGAVYVSYNGRCFLYEGSIENCTAKHRTIAAAANSTVNAAGGAVYAVGLLQMENSTIKNCTAEYGKGGGVYLYPEQGTFWMQDSQISGCAATENADADLYYNDGRGGAVYVGKAKNTDAPDLCVVGSRITGNTAKEGGGVYLHEDGTMAAYKEAYVSENTGGNVFVSDGAAIIAVMEYSQYALTGNALIGVTTRTEPTIGAPVRFGKTKADCKEYFISDSGNADVIYDADGKALLLQCTKKEETPAATFNATGYDTGTLDGLTAGMTYAVNGGTPVTVEGTSVTFTDIALPFVITVIQPGDGVTTYDSDPQTIELTRPDAPTLEVTPIEKAGDKGVIPTTTAHQKSTDGSVWTDCDGAWTDLDGGTYYVRTKASGTVLASGATQFFFRYDPQTDVTVTAATQKEDTVITATFALGTMGEVEFTLTGKENQYSFTAPIEFGKAQISQKLATDDYALTVSFAGSEIFLSDTVQTSFTVACAHEWNEPEWDWTQDVDNPTYTASCKLCADGTVSDSVQSVKGDRVEATVNEDAYTPYTATVTLNGQPFTGTFNLVEKGTALAAYKEQMKQAAEDKRLPGDSDACNRLIDDAIDAIDAVTYDETKSLDENKSAVDDAANFAQLDANLAEHRAIHYADFYVDGKKIASVPYTIDTKHIDEPEVPARFGYSGVWTPYTFDAGGVQIHAVYTLAVDPSVTIECTKNHACILYHDTVAFVSQITDLPDGAVVRWYVDGEYVGVGDMYTLEKVSEDFTIQAKIVDTATGQTLAESNLETVSVRSSWFIRLLVAIREAFLWLFTNVSLPVFAWIDKLLGIAV